MCSKLEGIFKHICVKAWAHAWSACHGILIPKKLKKSETYETMVDAMSCHQDDVVKNWQV